jgi:hypothetical protein
VALELPDFNLSEERAEFRDTLRRYFEEHASITEVRRVMESSLGISEALWKGTSEDLGLAGLAIADSALCLGRIGGASGSGRRR